MVACMYSIIDMIIAVERHKLEAQRLQSGLRLLASNAVLPEESQQVVVMGASSTVGNDVVTNALPTSEPQCSSPLSC